ncbi:hypothetical protein MTO96_011246 [Rhipicephalus appendiculatus]
MSVRWEDQQPSSYLEQADEKSTEDEQRDLEESSNDRTVSSLMPAKPSLMAAVLLLSAVVAGTFFTGAHSHQYGMRWRTPSPRLCRSEPCRRLATLLADAVNRSARPCVNFHDYVCGGWLQSRSTSVLTSLRGELIDKITREARNLEVSDLHQTPSEKAARYFTACYDVVSNSEDHLEEVKELLRKGGIMWPDMDARADLLDAIFYMSRVVRVPILFELSFDRGTPQKKIFVLNTMHLLNRIRNRKWEIKKSSAKNFFRTLYEAFSGEQASDTERRFTSLEEQQSELFDSLNASLSSLTQQATTTSEIYRWTKTISKKRWQAVFYKYFKITQDNSFSVVVDSKSYFMAFFEHYRKSGPVQAMDLYGYLCAQALFSFTNQKIIASYYGSQHVSSQHREHCFYQTDYFMHYAFQHSLFKNVTQSIRDDVTRLVARLVRALDNTLNAYWSFFGDCPAYANDKERLLHVFQKYTPHYIKETYSSYPDMTSNSIANWIGTAEAASAMSAEEIPVGDLMFGREARVKESPVDLAYLDVLWYTLGAPNAVKLAGLGSQVTKMVFHEVLSSKKPCQRLLRNTDKLWECMTATEPNAEHLRAVKENVLVSQLSQIVLWPILRDSLAEGSRALADFGSLPEPELFFRLGLSASVRRRACRGNVQSAAEAQLCVLAGILLSTWHSHAS